VTYRGEISSTGGIADAGNGNARSRWGREKEKGPVKKREAEHVLPKRMMDSKGGPGTALKRSHRRRNREAGKKYFWGIKKATRL